MKCLHFLNLNSSRRVEIWWYPPHIPHGATFNQNSSDDMDVCTLLMKVRQIRDGTFITIYDTLVLEHPSIQAQLQWASDHIAGDRRYIVKAEHTVIHTPDSGTWMFKQRFDEPTFQHSGVESQLAKGAHTMSRDNRLSPSQKTFLKCVRRFDMLLDILVQENSRGIRVLPNAELFVGTVNSHGLNFKAHSTSKSYWHKNALLDKNYLVLAFKNYVITTGDRCTNINLSSGSRFMYNYCEHNSFDLLPEEQRLLE